MASKSDCSPPEFKTCGICTVPIKNINEHVMKSTVKSKRLINEDSGSDLSSSECDSESILSMISTVFQYPFNKTTESLEFSREIENLCVQQDPFLTCENCSKNVRDFYSNFLKLQNMIHEASKLSNFLQEWKKVIIEYEVKDSVCEKDRATKSTNRKRKPEKIKIQKDTENVSRPEKETAPKKANEIGMCIKEEKMMAVSNMPEVCNVQGVSDVNGPTPPRRTSSRIQRGKKEAITSSSSVATDIGKIVGLLTGKHLDFENDIKSSNEKTSILVKTRKKSQRPKNRLSKQITNSSDSTTVCRCTVCHQNFSDIKILTEHITSVHDAPEKEKDPSIVKEEGLSLEPSEGGEIPMKAESCPQCNKEFRSKQQLREHVLFHTENVPRFGCAQCPKKFFKPKSLRKHLLNHSTSKLTCSECNKIFTRSDHLKRHMRIHEREKAQKSPSEKMKVDPESKSLRHVCSVCRKGFIRKEYLEMHMRIHTGERPFQCGSCGKTFRDPRNLNQHLVTHKTDRPFCCSVCGMTFKRAHHLKDHEKTHQENVEKPFVCQFPMCEKAFRLKKHLTNHELCHSTSKDHTCHVCGKAFNRKDNLRQHINKVHGKQLADDLLEVVEKQNAQRQSTMSLSSVQNEGETTKNPVGIGTHLP